MLMHEDYAADCEHCLRCPCNYLYDCYYHGFGMNIDHVRYWHLMKCWTDLLLQSFLGLTDVEPDFVMPRRLQPLNLNFLLLGDQKRMRFVGHKLKKEWTFKAIVVCYHPLYRYTICYKMLNKGIYLALGLFHCFLVWYFPLEFHCYHLHTLKCRSYRFQFFLWHESDHLDRKNNHVRSLYYKKCVEKSQVWK